MAEAAGLAFDIRELAPRGVWRHLAPSLWARPLRAVAPDVLAEPWPGLAIGCGGKSAAILAALDGRVGRRVIIQHPRMDPRRFDLVLAARHDGITGPNVIVTRTALHRVSPEKLASEASIWRDRLASLPRPLVAVLVGGSNGRYRLEGPEGAELAQRLAGMVRTDGVGLAITPSRRTSPSVRKLLADTLRPLGAYVWDMEGENPYFGLLALADGIVVTNDSVSMMSEAVATSAPVFVHRLPGRSRRQGFFLDGLIGDGRIRLYQGRFEPFPAAPLDDTAAAAAEMRRRLDY